MTNPITQWNRMASANSVERQLADRTEKADKAPDATAAAATRAPAPGPREVRRDGGPRLAPRVPAGRSEADTRRIGVGSCTGLGARGGRRGIAPVIATQRLAKLSASVISELQNFLIGINVFDRDIARAADILGFGARDWLCAWLLPSAPCEPKACRQSG